MMRRALVPLVLSIAVAVAVLHTPDARGEHTPSHRYFIVGIVTNELGEPVCGVTVHAADIDQPASDNNRTAVTDGSGAYSIQLHMHALIDDETGQTRSVHNEGDRILVTTANASSIVVFADKNTANPDVAWGQQTVDLIAVGIRGQCPNLAIIALGIGGVAVAIILIVWFVRRPRRSGRGSRAGLRKIPSVGRARARELEGMGIRDVEDLAAASPDKLSAGTTLTPKQARLVVKRANEALGKKA